MRTILFSKFPGDLPGKTSGREEGLKMFFRESLAVGCVSRGPEAREGLEINRHLEVPSSSPGWRHNIDNTGKEESGDSLRRSTRIQHKSQLWLWRKREEMMSRHFCTGQERPSRAKGWGESHKGHF